MISLFKKKTEPLKQDKYIVILAGITDYDDDTSEYFYLYNNGDILRSKNNNFIQNRDTFITINTKLINKDDYDQSLYNINYN